MVDTQAVVKYGEHAQSIKEIMGFETFVCFKKTEDLYRYGKRQLEMSIIIEDFIAYDKQYNKNKYGGISNVSMLKICNILNKTYNDHYKHLLSIVIDKIYDISMKANEVGSVLMTRPVNTISNISDIPYINMYDRYKSLYDYDSVAMNTSLSCSTPKGKRLKQLNDLSNFVYVTFCDHGDRGQFKETSYAVLFETDYNTAIQVASYIEAESESKSINKDIVYTITELDGSMHKTNALKCDICSIIKETTFDEYINSTSTHPKEIKIFDSFDDFKRNDTGKFSFFMTRNNRKIYKAYNPYYTNKDGTTDLGTSDSPYFCSTQLCTGSNRLVTMFVEDLDFDRTTLFIRLTDILIHIKTKQVHDKIYEDLMSYTLHPNRVQEFHFSTLNGFLHP